MTSGCAGWLDDKWASLTNRSNPLLCHGASARSMLRRSGQGGSLLSTDAGTAMGGRMCVGRSVFAVRLRTPSRTLLRTSCRWRSGATPVTTVPPSLANRMLSLLICVANDAVIMLSLPHVICWEHGVEGGQAVTTKDRARGRARRYFSNRFPCGRA